MGFFSRLRKPDAATKAAQEERAKREAKQGARNRRQSRDELRHWEQKYGQETVADAAGARGGSSSSDDRTVVVLEAATMEKDRSRGSMSTFKSYKLDSTPQRASIDFLPRIELTYGEPASFSSPKVATIAPPATAEGAPSLSREGSSSDGGSRRPALAVIQSSEQTSSRSAPTSKRDSYLSERQIQVASPQPRRQSRAISMHSLALPTSASRGVLATSPKLQDLMNEADHDDDDDDLPLAAVRSKSSPVIPQRVSMYALSSPSPALGAKTGSSSTPSLALPTSRSRASLSIPPALLPPSPTLEALAAPRSLPREDTQRSLAAIGRTGTLIDLTAPSTFDPYYGKNRRAQTTTGAERIAIGERRKASPPNGANPVNGKKASSSAQIMEFGELEERHKKRMSTLQGTANEKVEAEKALAMYQEKQRKEAEAQRRREARRSVDSNLYLLGSGGAAKAGDASTKRSSRMSVSNLSLLLKRGGGNGASETKPATPPPGPTRSSSATPEDDDVPLNKLSRSPPGAVTSSRPPIRSRRASTQALTTTSQRRPALASPSPSAAAASGARADQHGRRHSLGTLLEVSQDQSDIQADLFDLHARATPSPDIEKVVEWRRRSSVHLNEIADSAPAAQRQQRRQSSSVPFGEAIVLQKVAQAAPPPQPKKKAHDWLAY
ncbi:hypothetical protein JCM8115_003215 [Rhodotorula mucilaginosa]|uniref:Uncharacterized protein n=1 Tax=Rhodotorula mucilaginosa TaxID=5537 RepID=A0A9P7B6J7_RHOMI|nr:hypothetical protein C6P46_004386 [Rhodotorula mucilaginosa]TKA56208.1 hypothetical protein B0A53_01498 [Rhodotorula sp. CCFEE 5036]